MEGAFFGGGVFHDFVLNEHALPFDDAEVIFTLLPNLALF
jgi:hypothetical protein